MTTKRPVRAAERGFSLVIAVGVIALLSLLGMLVLDQVGTDTQLAGGERASQNAMYIAEGGAVWGRGQVVNIVYGVGAASGATANPTAVTALPAMPATDDICPENKCVQPPCPAAIDCTAFRRVTAMADPNFSNGYYRVAVRCNPSCTGSPMSYTVRSLGYATEGNSATGPRHLVEMTLGAQ